MIRKECALAIQKKGQITLFVILGILLVLALVILVVFREEITLAKILPERIFPSKTGTIERYIESCIESTGTEALMLLGAQGGYLWLPSAIENNPLSYIDTGIRIPLWQYNTESRIPSLELIEAQIGKYVSGNTRKCIDNLEAFRNSYDIVEKGELAANAKATDALVKLSVQYPIDVVAKDGTKITELEKFEIDLDVRLKQAYEVARAIMEAEAKETKFEKLAVDLLALDSSIPLSGIELGCTRKVWTKQEVTEKIKILLRTNLPSIRVGKTSYIPIPDDELYIKNHYVWDVTDINYNDIKPGFSFIDNNFFRMDVRPNSGQLLKSSEVKGNAIASFLCTQQWNFVYDLDFPVVTLVKDAKSDFVLSFGFIGHIKNNRANREPLGTPMTVDFTGSSDDAYCSNIYGEYNMRIFTYDNISDPIYYVTPQPINNVNISFTCLKYTCKIGKTKYASRGAISLLEAKFPYCVNGIVKAAKEGYKPAQEFVTTSPGEEVSLYLTPLKKVKTKVIKHMLDNNVLLGSRMPDSDEKAFITLKYLNNRTILHESWNSWPSDKELELLAEADFPYELEVYLMDDNNIVGGYKGIWTPKWSELSNAKSVAFPVIAKESFTEEEMLEFMNNLEALSKQVEPVIE